MIYKILQIAVITFIIIGCKIKDYHSEEDKIIGLSSDKTKKPSILLSNQDPKCKYVRENNLNCQLLENIPKEPRLNNPIDISVTGDGNTVYLTQIVDWMHDCKTEKGSSILNRNLIYKIKKNKKMEAVKINNKFPLSCRYGSELEIDKEHNLFINDLFNHEIYKISEKENTIEQITKIEEMSPYPGSFASPKPTRRYLDGPENMLLNDKNLYFIMSTPGTFGGAILKKREANGNITTLYDTGIMLSGGLFSYSVFKDTFYIWLDEAIPPYPVTQDRLKPIIDFSLISFGTINSIKINSKREFFILDSGECIVYKVIPSVSITRFAGSGKPGFKDGKGENAEFNNPNNMDFDSQDNLYVADRGNNAIRKITPDGTVTTFYSEK